MSTPTTERSATVDTPPDTTPDTGPTDDPGHLLPDAAWAEVVARVERDADPDDPFSVTDGLTPEAP